MTQSIYFVSAGSNTSSKQHHATLEGRFTDPISNVGSSKFSVFTNSDDIKAQIQSSQSECNEVYSGLLGMSGKQRRVQK